MKNWILAGLVAVAVMALGSGCKSASGSREYIPGRGWQPNN